MKASSLHSRLWWSYVLVSAAALGVAASMLFIYIIRNPSTYRQASARLTVAAALLRKNEASLNSTNASETQAAIAKVDSAYGTRIIIYDKLRRVVADSRAGEASPIRMPALPRLKVSSVLRDTGGAPWLYIIQHLSGGRWLLAAVPRPAVPILSILGDELFLPVVVSAGVALIASLLVAFWQARWIGEPLQKVVAAARKMPLGGQKPLQPEGPREVQELTQAFNDMEARLQASQQSQREFVANVSHELKTPLTSVQGFAQALLDGAAESPEEQAQAAKVIHEEAGRMHRMVLDLLELARLDAGTLDLQLEPVQIGMLLENVAARFTPQARQAGVEIQLEAAENLPVIWGDGDRLAQVFGNLVDNALKNTPAGGKVSLRADRNGAAVQVEVQDTGCGIPEEALPHIFERFYQADPNRPGGEKHGTGLGLAIVKEITAAHGGKISVRSKTVSNLNDPQDSGSLFTVTLPLAGRETLPGTAGRKKT